MAAITPGPTAIEGCSRPHAWIVVALGILSWTLAADILLHGGLNLLDHLRCHLFQAVRILGVCGGLLKCFFFRIGSNHSVAVETDIAAMYYGSHQDHLQVKNT